MKHVALLFLAFLIVFIFLFPKEKVMPSYLAYEEDQYGVYQISFFEKKVSTKELEKQLIDGIEILSIEPLFSKVVTNKLEQLEFCFDHNSDQKNIDRFLSYYKKELEKNGFYQERIYLDYQGILIKSMKVRTSRTKLEEWKEKVSFSYQLISS